MQREAIIQISGSLDMETAGHWAATLTEAATRAAVVTVDTSHLEFIDSTGAGTLLRLTQELGNQGCLLLLRNLQPEIHEVLDVMGVIPMLNITSE